MTRTTYQGEYLSICLDATGTEFAQTADEVLVVPLTSDGEILLTVEPSAAFDEPVLLLPGGTVEPGESLEETANRELQEEIGFRAGRLDFLAELRPYSKYLRVRSVVYLGRDLTPSRLEADEAYPIGVKRVPIREFEAEIAGGRLRDARVIAALYLTQRFLDR
jgi:ADP compounds hydrolase